MYQVSEALDKVISGSGRTFYARLNEISDGIQEIVQTNFSTPDSYFYVGGAIASKIEVSMFKIHSLMCISSYDNENYISNILYRIGNKSCLKRL